MGGVDWPWLRRALRWLQRNSPLGPDSISPDRARIFGLCDLGMGFPELGYVSLSELASVRNALGLNMERDLHWKAKKPLSEYATEARQHQRIIA